MHVIDLLRIYIDHLIEGQSEIEAVGKLVDLLGGLIASGKNSGLPGVDHFERNLTAYQHAGAGITTLTNDVLSLSQRLMSFRDKS